MFYLRHMCNSSGADSGAWSLCTVGRGGCGLQRGSYKKASNTVDIGYSTVSVLLSVGSVTKARLRCSCDEPSSDAVMCSVSSPHLGLFCRFSCFSSVLCLLSPPSAYSGGGGSVAPEGPRHEASPVSSLAVILHSWTCRFHNTLTTSAYVWVWLMNTQLLPEKSSVFAGTLYYTSIYTVFI